MNVTFMHVKYKCLWTQFHIFVFWYHPQIGTIQDQNRVVLDNGIQFWMFFNLDNNY